jgi:hypothetical protein
MSDEGSPATDRVGQIRNDVDFADRHPKLRLTRGQRIRLAMFLGFVTLLRRLNVVS